MEYHRRLVLELKQISPLESNNFSQICNIKFLISLQRCQEYSGPEKRLCKGNPKYMLFERSNL